MLAALNSPDTTEPWLMVPMVGSGTVGLVILQVSYLRISDGKTIKGLALAGLIAAYLGAAITFGAASNAANG